jgi:hypothetical protein
MHQNSPDTGRSIVLNRAQLGKQLKRDRKRRGGNGSVKVLVVRRISAGVEPPGRYHLTTARRDLHSELTRSTPSAHYNSFSTGTNSGAPIHLELLVCSSCGTTSDSAPAGYSGTGFFFTVGLYANNSTTPGSLITDLGTVFDSSLTSGASPIDVILKANPVLSSRTRYWIGLPEQRGPIGRTQMT